MSTRIYVVTDIETSRHRLIRAKAQAIRHAAQTRFDIEVAGIPIELAGAGATADMFEDAITNAGGTD